MTRRLEHDPTPAAAADLSALSPLGHDRPGDAGEPAVLQSLRDGDPGTVWDLVVALTRDLSAAREEVANLTIDRLIDLRNLQTITDRVIREAGSLRHRNESLQAEVDRLRGKAVA